MDDTFGIDDDDPQATQAAVERRLLRQALHRAVKLLDELTNFCDVEVDSRWESNWHEAKEFVKDYYSEDEPCGT